MPHLTGERLAAHTAAAQLLINNASKAATSAHENNQQQQQIFKRDFIERYLRDQCRLVAVAVVRAGGGGSGAAVTRVYAL